MSLSPARLILHYRMQLAKEYLTTNTYTIEEVALSSGFGGIAHFSRKFKYEFKCSPSAYRENESDLGFNNEWKVPLNDLCFDKLMRLQKENSWLKKMLTIMIDNLDNERFTMELLADRLFMSPSTLNRKVKTVFGFSTMHLLRDIKLQYAIELIVIQKKSITEAAFFAGFFDIAHFSRVFKQSFDCAPGQYSTNVALFPFVDLLRKQP